MNTKRKIINSILFIIFLIIALYSCKKQNEIVRLSMDKLYILEYRYILPEEHEESRYKFYVGGFCELDNDFNVKYARRLFFNSCDFYTLKDIIPDSLRNKISNTLLKYQTDTTFLYQGGFRLYEGSKYRFIIQKHNQKDVTIKFEPEFLPEDLKFVYLYLYEDRKKTECKSTYNDLLKMFKYQVKDDTLDFPPPALKSTIKFTLPDSNPYLVKKIANKSNRIK
jgi:hypothetical protein